MPRDTTRLLSASSRQNEDDLANCLFVPWPHCALTAAASADRMARGDDRLFPCATDRPRRLGKSHDQRGDRSPAACASIDDIVTFYGALGFTTTYKQRKPNPCVALKREDLNLHFFEIAGFDPE